MVKSEYLGEYRPNKESLEAMSFFNMMFDKDTHSTPMAHYYFLDNLMTPHHRVVAELSRGMAKSTLVSHKLPLYIALLGRLPNFGEVKNCVLISDTYDQAWNQLQTCIAYYNSSDELQSFVDIEKTKEGMVIFRNQRGQRLHISVRGSNQSFRGTNFEGTRPQLVIADDILSDEILRNPEAARKLNSWWIGTVIPALDVSHNKVIVVGTPMTELDLISSLMGNPEYHKVKFPVADCFSLDPSKIKSNWADRFTPSKIISLYSEAKAIGCEADFFREYYLEIRNDETSIFKSDWLKKYQFKDLWKDRQKYNYFITMDLAVSLKQSADRSVIMCIAVDGDGVWYIVDVAAGRFNPSEVIDHLFRMVRKFKPLEVRAEKAALQQVLNHFVEQKMLREKTHFLFNALENNSTQKKEYRILGLQPLFKARKIMIPSDICQDEVIVLEKELLGQTKEGNTTGHDDLVDCLANFQDPNFVIKPYDYSEDNVEYRPIKIIDSTVF